MALGAVGAVIRKKDDTISVIKLTDSPSYSSRFERRDQLRAYFSTTLIDHDGSSFAYWVAGSKSFWRSIDPQGTLWHVETLTADAEDGLSVSGCASLDYGRYVSRCRRVMVRVAPIERAHSSRLDRGRRCSRCRRRAAWCKCGMGGL
ncbi:MAG: hypothetical protein U0165_05095 [Polyangiaceae bacterium]